MAPTSPTKSSLAALPGRDLVDGEVELGKVVGFFGVRGELRVHLHSRERSVLLESARPVVLIDPDGARFGANLSCRSGSGNRILGRIQGIQSRDLATALMGWRIAIARDDLPPTDTDEFYVADLQGLTVTVDGQARGRVVDVVSTPGGDLLELLVDGETVFVAFSSPAVLDVDLDRGVLIVGPEALHDE